MVLDFSFVHVKTEIFTQVPVVPWSVNKEYNLDHCHSPDNFPLKS
jgi:hypothetical protein